jgi:hypothetical protein
VARLGTPRNKYRILEEKPLGTRPLEDREEDRKITLRWNLR